MFREKVTTHLGYKNKAKIKVYYLIILFIFFLIILVTASRAYHSSKEKVLEGKSSLFDLHQTLTQSFIDDSIKDYHDKLLMASDSYVIHNIQIKAPEYSSLYKTLLRTSKAIYQIRYIDNEGHEILRINKAQDGNLYITPEYKLQDKSDRFYFKETSKLKKGELYISELTLNREFGKVEIPYIPTLRFAVPVFLKDSEAREGVVIINSNADYILNYVGNVGEIGFSEFNLVDMEGEYLFTSGSKDILWGSKENLGTGKSLLKSNSKLYDLVKKNKNGQIYCDIWKSYYFYRLVKIGDNSDQQYFMTGVIPDSSVTKEALALSIHVIVGDLLVLLLIAVVLRLAFIIISRKNTNLFNANRALTEKKAALDNTNQRLRQIYKHVNKSRQDARSANRAKSEFISMMSHELRTPLNAIIGFSEILRDEMFGQLNAEQKDYVGETLEAGNHLLSLINDILDIAKVEAGKMDLNPSDLCLHSFVNNSLYMIREKCMKRGIEIIEHLDVGEDFIFTADGKKMKQVLYNLLSNAEKFTNDNGRIEIGARSNGRTVEFYVKDNGIGIEAKDRDKVFQKFQQIDSSLSRMHQGTGLGMPLTKKLVELHGGRIWFESDGKGKGTTFYIEIPVKLNDNMVNLVNSINKNLIVWNENHRVNVKKFDEHHKKLLDIINAYSQALIENSAIDRLNKLFSSLKDYGVYHLAAEEEMFAKYSYPDAEKHIKAHQKYREKMDEFEKEREKMGDADIDIVTFVIEWWNYHIQNLDKMYSDFFKENGLS